MQQSAIGEEGLPQGIHRVGEGQAEPDNLEDNRHSLYGEKDSAQKDHGKAKEIGHGHGFKNLSYPNRNEDSDQGKG